ncbi:DUF2244 domain-containing protein [Rhodoplanes sp. TEM]|uniref:DUF2244 domain-containing protein n=1 Tax=Rhodoplanes tepidamans TaxID=200616 RepID=A0ABT5J9J5_RHOTP|nr:MULTISPECIES: DUF2244 domain-containing protein [Rhodoplanes]MDC7786251.1 DUF2244 domain-containing protein [Rhodoplanes tepidamans]MDC7982378.1 DUF2244 domain-containing protein [Rhodoplanes sp. TEM]MDQ0355050.1 putative membrane protein [Rhodoplanes tepidamans]
MASSSSEPPLFSAVVTPHRSLDRAGVRTVILLLAAASGALGLVFVAAGAWPVTGFLGLDVALVYWAFRINRRRAVACEHVLVTPSVLAVRRVDHTGAIAEWTLNPVWVRLDREVDPDFGLMRIALVSHGRRLVVGAWLSPAERESFAAALAAALGEARRGPTRTPAASPGNRVDPPAPGP